MRSNTMSPSLTSFPALVSTAALRRCTGPVAALLLAGCTSLAPSYQRPALPVPAQLPLAPEAAASAPAEAAAPLAWQDFVRDPALRRLIEQALANNRDLRVAALNVERAQAQLDGSLAERWPTLAAGLITNSQPNAATGDQVRSYTLGVQMASWELDFLGRVRSGNDAARERLLATEAGRRSAELSLVGAVVSSWLALEADARLIEVAQRTRVSREQSLALTRRKADAGAASVLELQSALSLAAQARVAEQQLLRQRAQDLSTLALLLGQAPAPGAVPEPRPEPTPEAAAAAAATTPADGLAVALAEVPVGLSSEVLLRRPDLVQAERQLTAANADIGAARAALFPRVTLTASAGVAAGSLSALFNNGAFAWTLGAQALQTIFDGGRNRAVLQSTTLTRDIAVAQYERAVQSAFKETADALAGLSTWRMQREAQAEQLDSAREIARLTELRLRAGAAGELDRLEAQRSLLAAEQALLQTRLAEQLNRVSLWKALGG